MFESFTQWHWVVFAWGQVVLAYAGYLIYLRTRSNRLATRLAEQEVTPSND